MFLPDLKDYMDKMFYMYVVPISMEQLPRLRLFKRKKPQSRSVTIIILSIKMYTSGLILVLIILGEQVQIGIQKYVNKYLEI